MRGSIPLIPIYEVYLQGWTETGNAGVASIFFNCDMGKCTGQTDRQILYEGVTGLCISVMSNIVALINMYQEHSMCGHQLVQNGPESESFSFCQMFVTPQSRSVPQPSSTYGSSKYRRSLGTCQRLVVNIASRT